MGDLSDNQGSYKMRKQLMGAAIAAVIAAPAMADDHSNKWYLNAGVGYQVFDSAWDLEETAAALFSVEQKLSKDWGVEVGVSYADADNRYNNSAADAEVTFISAIQKERRRKNLTK